METMRRSTVQAFDAVAWREPIAKPYESRPAEATESMPSLMEELRNLPRVVYAIGGGVMAAVMGALLGGAMHI